MSNNSAVLALNLASDKN